MSYWDTGIGPGKREFHQFRKSLNRVYESRQFVANRLREIAPDRVLDAGCGLGDDCRLFLQMGLPFDYYCGLDSCEQFVEENRRTFPGMEFETGDIRRLPFYSRTFHTVICRSVLEHLPDPYPAISEMGRVSRERIILTWHSPPGKLDRLWYDRKKDLWKNVYSRARIKAILFDCKLELALRTRVKDNEIWEIGHA